MNDEMQFAEYIESGSPLYTESSENFTDTELKKSKIDNGDQPEFLIEKAEADDSQLQTKLYQEHNENISESSMNVNEEVIKLNLEADKAEAIDPQNANANDPQHVNNDSSIKFTDSEIQTSEIDNAQFEFLIKKAESSEMKN